MMKFLIGVLGAVLGGAMAGNIPTGSEKLSPVLLESYLSHHFSSRLEKIQVEEKQIVLSGVAGKKEPLFLAEVPMEYLENDLRRFKEILPVSIDAEGKFKIAVPRIINRDGRENDRLTSRWQLVSKTGEVYEVQSHARYADEVFCKAPDLPEAKPVSKKGLGGWDNRVEGDLEALGISAVTVNVVINALVSLNPDPGTTPFVWQGRTYYSRDGELARLDKLFSEAEKKKVMVSAILLVANPATSADPAMKLLGSPDANREGVYAMPNVTSSEGISFYGAILNLMAERWSKADGPHGRVHHWIMHNEVDAGWIWTNAGEKADVVYMDLYQRSMRLMDLIGRQYDPNMRPFISLTHHWAEAGEKRWYGSRRMLELLGDFTEAEGDFPWGLAYHPYPQDLFNPRTWEDDQAVAGFDTPKITPKNLEVLDQWMHTPRMKYRGELRPVHLSENGFNSRDYTPEKLAEQAAGMAFAWKKIAGLESIQIWHYHNWVDHPDEGGLRIGLRKFPKDMKDPLGKKPIWFLYQALGTAEEDQIARPYLSTIGIESWDD